MGRVGRHTVAAGSPGFLATRFPAWPPEIASRVNAFSADGVTPIVVAVDGAVCGAFGLGEVEGQVVRREARLAALPVGLTSGAVGQGLQQHVEAVLPHMGAVDRPQTTGQHEQRAAGG